MPTSSRSVIVALLCGLAPWGAMRAAEGVAGEAAGNAAESALLLFGPAVADIFDPTPRAMGFVEFRYETGRLRPGPWLAVEATARDLFVGFGAFLDLPIGGQWLFTPSLGAATYREHDGLGLGDPLEFRVTAEFTRRLERGRFGASLAHFSNAGVGDNNPGTEIIKLVWVVPLSRTLPP